MLIRMLGGYLCLLYGLGHASAMAESAAPNLFGKDPGDGHAMACFARDYDAAHLKAHPKQNVTKMMLFVDSTVDPDSGRGYSLAMGAAFRGLKQMVQLSGFCGEAANGKTALNCGIDCDGGEINVKLRDASSILVDIPNGARTWDPESGEDQPKAKFGPDDKVFRLDAVPVRECLPLVYDEDVKGLILAQH